MTDEQRREIRERADKATPARGLFSIRKGKPWRRLDTEKADGSDEDFDYHARTDIPALLDEIERLRKGEVREEWRTVYQHGTKPPSYSECRSLEEAFQTARAYAPHCIIQHRIVTTGEWREYREEV